MPRVDAAAGAGLAPARVGTMLTKSGVNLWPLPENDEEVSEQWSFSSPLHKSRIFLICALQLHFNATALHVVQ